MPRRSMAWRKVQALDEPHKLAQLQAIEDLGMSADLLDISAFIPGTAPEKLVYNYLLRLGVRFQFQYHSEDYEGTALNEEIFIPDFYLPDWNTTIEVYGYYWHSQPRRREADLKKISRALYDGKVVIEHGVPLFPSGSEAVGKYIIWWDYEIYDDLGRLFARESMMILEGYLPETFPSYSQQMSLKANQLRRLGIGRKC